VFLEGFLAGRDHVARQRIQRGPRLPGAVAHRRPDATAAVGTVRYLALIMLLGAGLGLLLRDTASAVTAALAEPYGSAVVGIFVSDPKWQHRIHRFAPMDAGLTIQSTRDLAAEHIGPWAGLGVLTAYAGAALIAGLACSTSATPADRDSLPSAVAPSI
jgi:hypothetical protein